MLRKPNQDPRAPRRRGEEGSTIPLARRGGSLVISQRNNRRAASPRNTIQRRDDQQLHGEERRSAAGATRKVVVALSVLKSGASLSRAVASAASARAADGTDAEEEEEALGGGSSSRCLGGGADGDGGGIGIELESKALNVSASGVFYERAASRRHRHKRALSENSESQAEAIPLGLGGASTGTARKKHTTTSRGSVLAPELPEASAEAAPTVVVGVGARKRPSGDADPHWNAVLLRKKAREEKERQQLAKRWRGSIITHRASVGLLGTTSTESSVRKQSISSGTKPISQSKRCSTGRMSELKEQQVLYNKLASSRGIAGAATTGVVRTGTSAAVKEAPRRERRAMPAASERRISASAPSVAQGILTSSSLGKPNGVAGAAGRTAVTRQENTATRPPQPALPPAPSEPEIIVIDD